MRACTRCGNWHKHAEAVEGKRLSCTEVKKYWAKVRYNHNSRYGHFPRISFDDKGICICLECKQNL